MVNLEGLTARAQRAYELGRLRVAARITFLLIPVVLACLVEPAGRETCGCLAVLLVMLAIGLRWRSARSTMSVRAGLIAGAFPLLVGLVSGDFSWAGRTAPGVALGAGILGGLALLAAPQVAKKAHWLPSAIVAALLASLGFARFEDVMALAAPAGVFTIAGLSVALAASHR